MRSAVRATGGAETMVWRGGEELEVFLGMGQRVVRDQRRHVSQLGGFGAKEFAPRRRVEEEIGDGDGGSAGQGGVVHAQNLCRRRFRCGFRPVRSPVAVSSVTRATEAMEGSASPRKPSVAIESRSSAVRSFEVAWRSKASSASSRFMPWPSSATRISLPPAGFDLDADAVGAGVERILQQFLDHGRWPVHHLAGGDLVGHLVGKNADAAHKPSG